MSKADRYPKNKKEPLYVRIIKYLMLALYTYASSTWDEKVCRNMAGYYSVIAPNHNSQLAKIAQD